MSNNLPTISVPGIQTVAETAPLVFNDGNENGIVVDDFDFDILTVRLAVTAGSLTLGSLEGVVLTGGATGSGTVTIQGSAEAINAALSGLAYTAPQGFVGDVVFTVEASDSPNGTMHVKEIAEFDISVFAAPIKPVITSGDHLTVGEHNPATMRVTAADDDLGDTLVFSLTGGVDRDLFTIDAATGQLTFIGEPDFEIPSDTDKNNIYEVEVAVTGNGDGLSAKQIVRFTVANVNEAPEIASTAFLAGAGQKDVGMVQARDPDALDEVTFAITGGDDAALFEINAVTGQLRFREAPDLDAPENGVYRVEVTGTDAAGLSSATRLIEVSVVPALAVDDQDIQPMLEDSGPITIDVLANDADGAGLIKATVDARQGTAAVVGGKVVFKPAADFHGTAVITYTVSNGTQEDQGQAAVTVSSVNDKPVVSGVVAGLPTEDAGSISLSALANASDVDAGTTLSVVNLPTSLPTGVSYNEATATFVLDLTHAAYQSLTEGQSVEVSVSYDVSDGLVTTPASVFWIITGSNDDASVMVDVSRTNDRTVTEASGVSNATAGDASASGRLRVADVDAGEAVFRAPASLNGTYGTFSFDAATGEWSYALDNTRTATQALAAGDTVSDTLTVISRDGMAFHGIVVAVTGANDAAMISGTATGDVTEDSTRSTGGVLSVADVDANESGFKAVAASDLQKAYGTFSFDALAGVWGFSLDNAAAQALKVGEQVQQTLTVESVGGTQKTVAVTVTGTNDAPTDLALGSNVLAENTATGATVGTLSAADVDGETLTFSLLNDAGGRFGLSSDGRSLIVANGTLLDYEQTTSHQVSVRARDGQGSSIDQTFTIFLADVLNETTTGSSSNDHLIGGKGNDQLAGGAGKDVLFAGAGNDRADGGSGDDRINGGYGKDTLKGGTGKDVFIFSDKLSKTGNLDTISDFSVKDDAIWLDNAIFKKLGKGSEAKPGKLNKGFFTFDAAKDKDDYLIYSKKTGVLSYDADGSGKGKAVEFAKLAKNLALTEKDFFVI